jgi:hypothetical protein
MEVRIPDIHSRRGGADAASEHRRVYLDETIKSLDKLIGTIYQEKPITPSVRLKLLACALDPDTKEEKTLVVRITRNTDDPRTSKYFDNLYTVTASAQDVPVNREETATELRIETSTVGLKARLYQITNPDSEHNYYKREIPITIPAICQFSNLIDSLLSEIESQRKNY